VEQNDALWDWNLVTDRVHFSPRWVSMLGCDGQEVGNTSEDWFCRIHPDDREQVRSGIKAYLNGSAPQLESQHRLLHKDGSYRWMVCICVAVRDETGKAVRLKGSHVDITAVKVADPLTGMPNRLLLDDRLARAIELTRRRNDFLFAVLLLDLDRFKSTVDRLGTVLSDQLLITVARRIETCLRAVDTVSRTGRDHLVARCGGDEFTILLEGLNEAGDAKVVAERLLGQISAPFQVEGHEVFLSASIGIALSATGYTSSNDALRDADIAMCRAKSLGRARCEVFDTAVLESASNRLELENDLQNAITQNEIQVIYQPIVSIPASKVAGFEVLARWKHPVRGIVSPLEFIPIAERTGFIVPLGSWVLQEACRQLNVWRAEPGISAVWVSVNFSGVQLMQHGIVEQIEDVLKTVGLEPHCLVVELTESAVMHNPDAVAGILMRLRALGVKIAIDDFGTGYSSLSYLRQFPLDFLKIDHFFVRRMGTNRDTREIVRSTVALAHTLGLQVIAEGIETAEQLKTISALQCEFGQGFLFGRPVGSQEAEKILKAGIGVPGQSTRCSSRAWVAAAALLFVLTAAGAFALIWNQPEPREAPAVPFLPVPVPAVTVRPKPPPPVQEKAVKAEKVPAPQLPATPEPPASRAFAVVHDHRLGSCKGELLVTVEGISYTPEKGNDGFRLGYSECTWEISRDQLTLRTGHKTWRFRSESLRSFDSSSLAVHGSPGRGSTARQ
jgi:diguanylate cyclase (GGDEF)-like protein/PAS domain S-box-containing protein